MGCAQQGMEAMGPGSAVLGLEVLKGQALVQERTGWEKYPPKAKQFLH